MPKNYVLNGEFFKSKEAVKRKCREILYRKKVGEPVDTLDFPFLRDLLNHHDNASQKIGCGVVSMYTMMAEQKTQCFALVRTDGSTTDFSFYSCLREKKHDEEAKKAMRNAILPQIFACKDRAFKDIETVPCPILGVPMTRETSHVDHAAPNTFDKLQQDFLVSKRLNPAVIQIGNKGDNATAVCLADPVLLTEWQEFHAKYAVLRVVSAHANLSILRREVP